MEASSESDFDDRVDIKLQDMLQIALGTPELRNANFSILLRFLNILLKRLGCESETVSLGGVEGKYVKKVLAETKPINLNFKDNEPVTAEQVCKEIEEVRNIQHVPKLYMPFSVWELYNQPCEDSYIQCNSDNYIACQLLHNTDFMQKLMRRIAFPLVERIFQIETKIERLTEVLDEFIKAIKEQFEKLLLIDAIVEEIEKVKERVNKNYIKFIGALEEIQDMMDTKLDKIHMPGLKAYIKKALDEIWKKINELEDDKNCDKAAIIIKDNIKCASCGNQNICTVKDQIRISSLPELKHICCGDKYQKKCECTYSRQPVTKSLVERIENLNVEKLTSRIKNKVLASCAPGSDAFLITGTDGNQYRGDPYRAPSKSAEDV